MLPAAARLLKLKATIGREATTFVQESAWGAAA